jgi:hypothetical protein
MFLLRHLLNLRNRSTTTTRERLLVGVNGADNRKPTTMMTLMTNLVLASAREVVDNQAVERCRA